jgi:hypothetical protein
MVPFTVQNTLDASATNPRRMIEPTPVFRAMSERRDRRRSERGTFWTILLQIELEEVNLKAVANRGL